MCFALITMVPRWLLSALPVRPKMRHVDNSSMILYLIFAFIWIGLIQLKREFRTRSKTQTKVRLVPVVYICWWCSEDLVFSPQAILRARLLIGIASHSFHKFRIRSKHLERCSSIICRNNLRDYGASGVVELSIPSRCQVHTDQILRCMVHPMMFPALAMPTWTFRAYDFQSNPGGTRKLSTEIDFVREVNV